MNNVQDSNISIKKAFVSAFEKFKEHKMFFFKITLIKNVLSASMLLILFFAMQGKFFHSGGSWNYTVNQITGITTTMYSSPIPDTASPFLLIMLVGFLLLFFILNSLVDLGFIKIALQTYDNQPSSIRTLFSCRSMVLRYMVGLILYLALWVVGLIFFVIPGIYFAVIFKFFAYAMVYYNLDIQESFRQSRVLSKDSILTIFGAWIFFTFFFLILKAIPLFWILTFFTIPFEYLVFAYFYKQLLEKHLPQINQEKELA